MLILNFNLTLFDFLHLRQLDLFVLFRLLFLIVLVDLHEDCEKDQGHSYCLKIVYLVPKMDDVYNHSETLPGCDYKGWDMLFEKFYHTIDNQLAKGIQHWKIKQIFLDLFVIYDEIGNRKSLQSSHWKKEGNQGSILVYCKVHLDNTRLVLWFYLCLKVWQKSIS